MRHPLRGPYRYVFLDIGETLVRLEPPLHVVLAEEASRLGARVALPAVQRRAAAAYRATATEPSARRFTLTADSSSAFWRGLYAELGREFGVRDVESFSAVVFRRCTRFESYAVVSGGVDVLRRLNRMGLRVVAVSNWEGWLPKLLSWLGLEPFLQAQAVSGLVGAEKPDPAIFAWALRRIRAKPAQVVHVGDSYALDVEGARAAGLDAIWLTDDAPADPGCPVIGRLDELPAVLRPYVDRPAWALPDA